MTAADLALWLALWLTPTALIFAWIAADTWLAVRADRADEARRIEQERQVTPEWLAVLAATDTPIFAEVWAESLRRDLEEWAK